MALRDAASTRAAGSKGQSVRIAGRWINNPWSPGLVSTLLQSGEHAVQVGSGAGLSGGLGAVWRADQATQSTRRKSVSLSKLSLSSTRQIYHGTFGATCQFMPNICDQPPKCDLRECCGLARGRCLHRCGPTRHPMKQQSNDQPAAKQQRRSARGQPAKASLPTARQKQPQRMRYAAVGG